MIFLTQIVSLRHFHLDSIHRKLLWQSTYTHTRENFFSLTKYWVKLSNRTGAKCWMFFKLKNKQKTKTSAHLYWIRRKTFSRTWDCSITVLITPLTRLILLELKHYLKNMPQRSQCMLLDTPKSQTYRTQLITIVYRNSHYMPTTRSAL